MNVYPNKSRLELCTYREKQCTKCDLIYIMKDYITPLMQWLSNDMDSFHMNMETTKCLNTGLMLMYFMSGQKGVKIVEKCDCNITRNKHLAKEQTNDIVLQKLKKSLRNKSFKNRKLYYILITDGNLKHEKTATSVYFPGHVFILEKFRDEDSQVYFNLYQSYIRKYDLKEHVDTHMNGSIRLTYDDTMKLIENINMILTKKRVWDTECCDIWRSFTKVNANNFLDCVIMDSLFICSDSLPLTQCISNIKKYLEDKLNEIQSIKDDTYIYGDKTKYGSNTNVLTIGQMKQHLQEMLNKINGNHVANI